MTIKRRPRGSMKEPASIGWEVEREVRDHFADLAKSLNYTNAAFLELVMRSLQVDKDGTLNFVVPSEINDIEGQLPIDKP